MKITFINIEKDKLLPVECQADCCNWADTPERSIVRYDLLRPT